jgi:hypothetical protein
MRFNALFLTRSILIPVSLSPDLRHFAGTIVLPGRRIDPSASISTFANLSGLKVRRNAAIIRLSNHLYLTPGAGPSTQKHPVFNSAQPGSGSACPAA